MAIAFKNPPLVEIIANVKWPVAGLPEAVFAGLKGPMPLPDSSAYEIQFMNFAAKAGAKGFGLVERVVPPGFPLLAHQVAFRYRNTTGAENAPLFQVGPGVFTANISPPYKSWQSFVPFIDMGLGLLIESRTEKEKDSEFSEVSLRYVDAFGDALRQGKSTAAFMAQDLGVHFQLPAAVMAFCTSPAEVKPNVTLRIPIENGTMELKIHEGYVRNAAALIMDTKIIYKGPFPSEKGKVLEVLEGAHKVIHESFVEMTTSLHQLMEREG